MIPLPLYPPAFQIGTRPTPIQKVWLKPDQDSSAHIADKKRIVESEARDRYFMARDDTLDAQNAVWAMLVEHLPTIDEQSYTKADDGISFGGQLVLPNPSEPLMAASMLVADDLVLMRRHDDGWRLVAAGLFAPSYWTLAEKFDRPLQVMHDPVPGFGPGSRKAELIDRMFDMLGDDIVLERRNWSFHGEGDWFTPGHHPHNLLHSETTDAVIGDMYVRREYQTIRKVPTTGDVLFTIHVTTQRLRDVRNSGEAVELAKGVMNLSPDQQGYKGLEQGRERLAAYLSRR